MPKQGPAPPARRIVDRAGPLLSESRIGAFESVLAMNAAFCGAMLDALEAGLEKLLEAPGRSRSDRALTGSAVGSAESVPDRRIPAPVT